MPDSSLLYQQWRRDGEGVKGSMRPGRHFPGGGISRKIKNRPVCRYASQLTISVQQTCPVTFKMHQIHLRPGSAPYARWGAPRTPSAGTSGKEGRQERTFAPVATDLGAATVYQPAYCLNVQLNLPRLML